jgi:hypothetical protein
MKAYLQLYIEGNRMDLFTDESVNVIQSIQNIKDISQIFVEFSRSFDVPASKKNNKVFKHYYNYSIIDGFDARLKKTATLELNHRPFKDGKIRLDGVDMRDGSPDSYRITFFGNTISLNDLVGDEDLSGLELSTFDTDYTAANVKLALTTALSYTYTDPETSAETPYVNAIIAPLISHTQRFYWSTTDGTAYSDTATSQNIDYNQSVHAGVYFEELKFGLRVHAIIEAIERKYGITFSEDFFYPNNAPYFNLYLWLHRKKGAAFESAEISKQITGFTIDRHVAMSNVRSESNELIISGLTTGEVRASLTITSTTSITATIRVIKDGTGVLDNGQKTMTTATSITLTNLFLTNGSYKIYIESEETSFTLSTDTQWALDLTDGTDQATYALDSTFSYSDTRKFIIAEQMPEMKVIDFLTGLFKMFNLTAYEDGGVIIVKPLEDYYADSEVVWDITKYVDQNAGTVDVALPYKEVEFKYEGLETKLAKQHNQLSNQSWGTEHYSGDDYYDASPSTYTVSLPFEHMKYERLKDDILGTTETIQVGWFVDDNSDPYFGKPLLFYAELIAVSENPISFLADKTSTKQEIDTSAFMPINSVSTNSSTSESSMNFKNEISEYTNTSAFGETLFFKYYKSYIQDVFALDKRLTTITAYLPIKILQEINLADTLAIFDRNYTINTLETDFKTGISKIEMINELTVSIGGSTPTEPPVVPDPDVCTQCSADSTLCTVDNTTPTADKTCDVGRSVTITGVTSADNTDSITLTATANNFIGTASYLWSGGSASGTTAAISFTEATSTGYIDYTCVATDDDDAEDFTDIHTVLWSPKKYTITLNVADNITGPPEGYFIGEDQTGASKSLVTGAEFFFNTTVTVNSGYGFTQGPSITNASGIVGTADATVNTILAGSVQPSNAFVTISGATARTIGSPITLGTTLSGISGTPHAITYAWSGGAASSSSSTATITETAVTQPTRPVTVTYTVTVEGTNSTTGLAIEREDTHDVNWTDTALITITLAIDSSSIAGPAAGWTITGDQVGLEKTQNSGTVFNFTSDVELNAGYEWIGDKPSVSNAGGTFTTSQTATTTFGAGTAQLIVYNYYIVTGCTGESVVGETVYIRSRTSFTVGSTTTGSALKINGNCYYASATTVASTWGSNDGVTVGEAEYVGCAACTDTEATTTDPCLVTKSKINLRYNSTSSVCESSESELFYYINGADDSVAFCEATNLYTYTDCTVNAPAGHYSLVSDNTRRRYWNGTAFSVCVNCLDANYLYYMGIGWNPLYDYCDDAQGIGGYYYFDNNATLTSANSLEKMYSNASNVGTETYAQEGFYTTGYLTAGSFYRYYEPQSLQVWEDYAECLAKPPEPPVDLPKPTLTVWRQYTDCPTGLTPIVFGNDSDDFPAVVQDGVGGACYSSPTTYSGSQSDDWIDDTTSGVNDFPHYNQCSECTGNEYYQLKKCSDNSTSFRTEQITSAITLVTNDRVTVGSIKYIVIARTYNNSLTSAGTVVDTGLSGCEDAPTPDNVFTVTRQSDGETTYIQVNDTNLVGDENVTISTDGANCYDIVGSESVADATIYGEITGSCIGTTTTTTTTTVLCGSQTLYTSTVAAQNACCDLSLETIYMDSNTITSATKIWSDRNCNSLQTGTKYLTVDLIDYYTWNGSTLGVAISCPACGNQP